MNYVVVTVLKHTHVFVVPQRDQFNTSEQFRRAVSYMFGQFLYDLPQRSCISSLVEGTFLRETIRSSILAGKSYQDYIETLLEGQ